ncbi:DEAD/DEAH box helicase family protein [Cyanobium sp. ATX 6E8]|uniref:DNA-directed RNA polymerase subunit alpha C-terminal domain-containing protein n=1 Tax=Cyanobium sp. ATX 6E8 TaxID=2823701 RepID=UPI0020CDA9EA|nr:DNA-directed RNA polymerase subunit alpha C-terminal domain-containing protein [Cyanobium sp. ATX 6E8]MCP9943004.1 DEAD/DEAH box helicase family protein [Cyanobium sp. ATX 6E8]
MGLRSFLKNTARALGLRKPSAKSVASGEVDYAITLDRIEQQIVEAATSRNSLRLLDLWHELTLWKAPPAKTVELKRRLAQLFEEFEGQTVNPNASSSTLLVLRSQVASKQRSERQLAEKEDQSRQSAEAEQLRVEQERQKETERLATEAAAQRRAEMQREKEEWARQKLEVDRLRQEQEQRAKEEAKRQAKAETERQEREAEQARLAAEAKAEADRLRAEQERQAEVERQAKAETERQEREAEQERLAAEAKAEADRLRAEQERQAEVERQALEAKDFDPQGFGHRFPGLEPNTELDLDPLAEDLVTLQDLNRVEKAAPELEPEPDAELPRENPTWLAAPIEALSLSIRATNSLYRGGIRTLADLAEKQADDLLSIRNFGQRGLNELIAGLENQSIPFPVPSIPNLDWQESDQINRDLVGKPIGLSSTTLLTDIGFPQAVLGPLLRSGIKTLGDLSEQTDVELAEIRRLGSKGIQIIRDILASHGLELPFDASDLGQVGPQSYDVNLFNQTVKADRKQQREDAIALVSDIAEKCLAGEPGTPEEAIGELLLNSELTQGHASLHTELSFLRDCLWIIESLLGPSFLRDKFNNDAWQELRRHLLLRYAHELGNDTSKSWLNGLQKSISRDAERGWKSYISRVCGITYQAIGEQLDPPVTRERVRQLVNRVARVIGVATDVFADRIQGSDIDQARVKQLSCIQSWLERFGRIAFNGDHPLAEENMDLWETALKMNPKQRLGSYKEYAIPVPSSEWDVHYEWICNNSTSMGNAYWKDFECLEQFILRHAVALGHPNAMPKQTSLPRRVGRIVQDFGGQSKVARRLGLRYQGQLVGEDGGRTYWTEDKLLKLLDDVNHFHNQDLLLMPSYAQIYDFFKEQCDEPYAGKNPGSPIAGMTRQGQLHWSEVASRFSKQFVSGASTANVTLAYIKAFVRDLGVHLEALTPSELYVLFQAQGINRGDKERFSRTFDRLVDAVQSGMVKREDLQAWASNNDVDSISELLEFGADLKAETNQADKESLLLHQRSKQLQSEFAEEKRTDLIASVDLPQLDPVKTLLALDKAASVIESSATDSDRIEFLKAKATAKLWDACFADAEALTNKLRIMNVDADTYSSEVRSSFLEEYEGARSLEIPSTYRFCDLKGLPRQPKLMQRLVAFRLKRDYRLLNLSGTGTGKTLSAVFAAQVCGCRRILVSCPNGVISSWHRTFSSAYPDAVIHIRPDDWRLPELDKRTHVVIVNHERFQNQFSQLLLEFCLGFQADLIVIDEIHQAKQRDKDKSSQRRRLMDQFIFTSANINSELRVLGLSATPVINNLLEGRSLIELVSQEALDGVDEEMDLNACMNLYQHFVVHGIRMNPGRLPRTELLLVDVDATSILPQVISATRRGSYHDVEQLLVQPKLDALKACLEPGHKTVIFITYIKSTLDPLCQWLKQDGYSYSVYTGNDKEASEAGYVDSLDEFIRGSTDILVASIQCAGTGVDGLQSVCNRAVFLQLPWTSTEFEQAIGRLDRDGTEFDSVKVYLPITDIHLPNGERWSWCRSKLDRIRSKSDIAKAAVDGEVPEAASMISPSQASEYWLGWLKLLEQEPQ